MSENYERLGNYVLLEKLNSGGMAEVFLSKSVGANGVNKFFAIKRILPQYADAKEFIDMFKEEAKIAVNLDHSNVVSIIDFKVSHSQLYLVMDYVQGQNLRQLLQQKKKKNLELNLPFIVYIIREVAAGLDHAHKCNDKTSGRPLNIIHRDMSPQNIMISYEGEIKVVDFGIAKAETAGDSTRVGTLKGKFSYMSPEQAEGLVIDQTTDIFSLGIILWELIADDRLFVANNEFNILKRIKECDIPDIKRVSSNIPPELEKIVKKSLMKDKTQRYQTASELLRDLTRFLNKEYPDFTRNDFATFMKFLFEDEFRYNQNQLVKYSKIQLESNPQNTIPENTFSVVAQSNDGAPKGLLALEPPALTPINPNPSAQLRNIVNNTAQNNLTNTKPLISTHSENINKSLEVRKTQSNISQAFQKSTATKSSTMSSSIAFGQIRGTSSSGVHAQVRFNKKKQSPLDSIVRVLSVILIVISILFGAYYFKAGKIPGGTFVFKGKDKSGHGKNGSADGKSGNNSTGEAGQSELGSTKPSTNGKYSILIQSSPIKARIYLNSIDTGLFSPAAIEVSPNTPFTITLLADGYLPYTGRYTATVNGQKLNANLQQISIGYVNIKVINAGVDTIVYVNDLKLEDKPPISRYPIPAGTPVRIRAEAPFTNASAETTVTVGKDEKTNVELILSTSANGR